MDHSGMTEDSVTLTDLKSAENAETSGDAPKCDRILAILEKIRQATMQQHVVVNGYAYDFSMLHLYPRLLEHVMLENDLSYRNFDVSSYALRNSALFSTETNGTLDRVDLAYMRITFFRQPTRCKEIYKVLQEFGAMRLMYCYSWIAVNYNLVPRELLAEMWDIALDKVDEVIKQWKSRAWQVELERLAVNETIFLNHICDRYEVNNKTKEAKMKKEEYLRNRRTSKAIVESALNSLLGVTRRIGNVINDVFQ